MPLRCAILAVKFILSRPDLLPFPRSNVQDNFHACPSWREWATVSFLFLFLIGAWLSSSLFNLNTGDPQIGWTECFSERFIGHPQSDLWKHVWGAWWTGSELAQGRWPQQTDLQSFPRGGKLYVIDQLNALITAIFNRFFSLAAAFNLTQALKLYASCCGAWFLARLITRENWSAALAGTIYGLCPFILTSGLTSAICETTNLEWLPISLAGLLLCLNSKSTNIKLILATSLALAFSALGSWYYAEACLLSTAILFVWIMFTGSVPACQPTHKAANHSPNWFCASLACLLSLVWASPAALLFADSLNGQTSLLAQIDVTNRQQAQNLQFFHKEGNFHNNASLAGYFLPGKKQISVSNDVDLRCKTTYIGWIAIILAVISLYRAKKSNFFWAVLGISALLISSGPYFVYYGSDSFAKPINIFYWIAYNLIPGFKMAVITDRFSIVTQLSVAILAALGLKNILKNSPIRKEFIVLAAIFLINMEISLISPVPFPLPSSSAIQPQLSYYLQKQPQHKAVLQLPLTRADGELQPGEYYYWQTCHGKPMAISLTTRWPRYLMNNLLTNSLILCEDPQYGAIPDGSIFNDDLLKLRKDGFGWICVNEKMMRKETALKVNKILSDLLGEPQAFSNGSKIYAIPD